MKKVEWEQVKEKFLKRFADNRELVPILNKREQYWVMAIVDSFNECIEDRLICLHGGV